MKKQGQEPASLTDTRAESARPQTPDDPNVEPGLMVIYTRLLHKKASLFVYLFMRFLFFQIFQDTNFEYHSTCENTCKLEWHSAAHICQKLKRSLNFHLFTFC